MEWLAGEYIKINQRFMNHFDINKKSWNNKTPLHLVSDFYDVEGFIAGKNALKSIEMDLLGDIRGKKILHLQCHFGQDSISLQRLGADVTGVDLSDKAIEAANELAQKCNVTTRFICCNIYDLPNHLDEQFDIVFTSYGTIGWLPDLDKWAEIVQRYLKPSGSFVFAEFHPAVWMFDDDFEAIQYNYFNTGPIIETYTGSYADKSSSMVNDYVMWNHSLSEVLNALIRHGIQIEVFNEFDYSPFDCFRHTEEFEPGKFRIKKFGNNIPMVFALRGLKVKSY